MGVAVEGGAHRRGEMVKYWLGLPNMCDKKDFYVNNKEVLSLHICSVWCTKLIRLREHTYSTWGKIM